MRSVATAAWPADVISAVALFRQGHLIASPPPFPYFGDPDNPLPPLAEAERAAPAEVPAQREFDALELQYDFGVITTQTCDIAEEGSPAQPFIQLTPVVKLDNGPEALPQYLTRLDPPDLPEGSYAADLRIEASVEKSVLVNLQPIEGFPDEAGYVDFARALGRRRERPAIASELVNAVAGTLKRRKTNSNGFKRLMRDHIHSVRLAIDEGTRLHPSVARVHFIASGPLPDEAREKLEAWWQQAYVEAEASGISLLPNEYHESTAMDIDVYDRTIPLSL
ncbi:MAG: hypothetical protein ACJ757_06830 [Gaiellaceae bacterium]